MRISRSSPDPARARSARLLITLAAALNLAAWSLACGTSGADDEAVEEDDVRDILATGALDYPTPASAFSTESTWSELQAQAPALFADEGRALYNGFSVEAHRYPQGVVEDSRPSSVRITGLDESFFTLADELYGERGGYSEGGYQFWSWTNPANHVLLRASAGPVGGVDATFRPYLDMQTCVGTSEDPLGFMGEAFIGENIEAIRARYVGRMTRRAPGTSGTETIYGPPCYPWTGDQEWSVSFGASEPGVVHSISTELHFVTDEDRARLLALLGDRFEEQRNISNTLRTRLFIPGNEAFEAQYTDVGLSSSLRVSIVPRR